MPKEKSSAAGITFRVSPNSEAKPEWGAAARDLWALELAHDLVDRERVTGADANEKVCTACLCLDFTAGYTLGLFQT